MPPLFRFRSNTVGYGVPSVGKVIFKGYEATDSGTAVTGDYYVATTGLDTNPGTAAQPWKTIQKALTVLTAGKTVLVRGGTYTCAPSPSFENVSLNPTNSGTSTAPITIRNYPGERPIIQFTAYSPGAAIGAYGRNYITWRGFEVIGNGPYAAGAFNASYITISHCVIHGTRQVAKDNTACIRVGNGDHLTFEHNELYDARNTDGTANGCAFTLYGCDDSLFQYNNIYNVGSGIHLKIQAADASLRSDDRNTFYRNYMHDFYSGEGEAATIMLNSGDAATGSACDDNVANENLLRNARMGWMVGQRYTNYRNHFYQNTVINMTDAVASDSAIFWFGTYEPGVDKTLQHDILFYNNIIYNKQSTFRVKRFWVWPPASWTFTLCDYNCYYSTLGALPQWVNNYTAAVTGLGGWQAVGYDAHGINQNPLFVNENGGDWRLAATSPCIGTGRDGRDMGCFANSYWLPYVGPEMGEPPVVTYNYYIATTGNDANPGTQSLPFRTFAKALTVVRPGDTVAVRGGTYTTSVTFGVSGTSAAPITWTEYPGESVIISAAGFTVSGSWNSFIGFEISNAPSRGVYVTGNDNTFRNLLIHNSGIFGYNVGGGNRNKCYNCISHSNYDSGSTAGDIADGFAVSTGSYNEFYDCESYNNSDDGFDLWEGEFNTVVRCIAHDNGYDTGGDGNGFKMGGPTGGGNSAYFCISYNNLRRGFTNNSSPSGVTWYNCVAWDNPTSYQIYGTSTANIVRNCIAYLSGSLDLSATNVTHDHNTWNLGITNPLFVSLTPGNAGFLRLQAGSPCINAGVNVGFTYNGTAPDLGAYETT